MVKLRNLFILAFVLAISSGASAQNYVNLWPNGANGDIDANGEAITVTNARMMGTLGMQITGTFTGTLAPQCSLDGTNWVAVRVTPPNSTSAVTSMTGTGIWSGSIAGCKQVRVVSTAWTSGTATVTVNTVQTGGGGGGGGASSSVEIAEGGATAQVTATAGGSLQVECTTGCTGSGTVYDHSEAITLASANGSLQMGRASAAAPSTTGVVDDDAVATWMLATGATVIQPSFAGVLASAGAGTNGTGVQRVTIATDDQLYTVLGTDTIFGTAGSADADVLTVQGIASMTPLVVNNATAANLLALVSGGITPADNFANPTTAVTVWSLNACFDGSTWDRCPAATGGSGVIDANTARVTLATDDELNDDADAIRISVELIDNAVSGAGFNITQLGGAAINVNTGTIGTGTLRTTIATDDDVSDAATLFEANLVAHDAVDAGSPLKVGFKATNTIVGNTPVANNDRTDAFAGLDGVLITRPHSNLEDRVSGTAGITDGSSTSIVAAQGAGVRFCATSIVVSNSSATNVTVDIRDGTAGTVLMTIPAAANMGGGVVPLQTPLCTTANTIFAADPSASATTVAVTAVGFKTEL